MKYLYVLQHVHEIANDKEDVKFIGVYSSSENAEKAKSRLIQKPGFSENRDGFFIDEYEIDVDHWTNGFHTTGQE